MKPRTTNNPTGIIDNACLATFEGEDEPFVVLNVPKAARGETYLAAFLSCWICKFLLPSKEIGHIRPGVFKVASLMAAGRRFSLAVLVLASIYNGLNKIVHSAFLKDCRATFPIHYVYAWIAQYFNTHYNQVSYNLGARMTRF